MPQPKPTQHIGRVGIYSLTTLPRDIQILISDGLTYVDETGDPIAALAKEWQVVDDGKTYIFTLNDDISWQDGTSFTSKDVNYTISDAELEIVDDKTVVFKLKEPFSPFPSILSQPLFKRVQKSYLQVFDRSVIIGTGDYKITNLTYDNNYLEKITLESATDKKIFKFYDTEQAAVTAFKLAEIDVIEDISSPNELSDWQNVSVSSQTNLQRYVAVFFNTEDRNLASKNIRQALTYAIPVKPEDNTRALGPVSPESWAYNPGVKPYLYSLEKAQELAEGNNMNFDIELATTPTYVTYAEEIKSSWEQLGVNVNLKVTNLPDTQNFQALLIGQQIPSDPDQYLQWHSTQNTNITHYQSPKVDKLLEDGRTQIE